MYLNDKESETSPKSKSIAETVTSSRSSGSVLRRAQMFERTSSKDSSSSQNNIHAIQRTRSSGTRSPATSTHTPNGKSSRTSTTHTEDTTKVNDTSSCTSATPLSPHPEENPNPNAGTRPAAAVVTPELLVDALSGHEDGLLAIAERLMDHYEGGYDVMGEAIIDAFADVQKLFQHVVEAAHMEGAAFEASRRETEESQRDYKRTSGAYPPPGDPAVVSPGGGVAAAGPTRHDEFIDQDVRDVLIESIHKGAGKKDAGYHMECYEIYEEACISASALLPVDSDHRGRLQLSIARAESMSPERACAILKYAMDDVLRSGQNFSSSQNPDPSKRGDCVLTFPTGRTAARSSEEALASLVEEMKDVLSAPVYENSPVQDVARRFWVALNDAKKESEKNEERLEQSLGTLKGDYLLSRAEWEEKINEANKTTESYKKKYLALKERWEQNRHLDESKSRINSSSSLPNTPAENDSLRINVESSKRTSSTPSVASFSSGIAQQAKSLVGSFACYGMGAADKVTTPRGDGTWTFENNRHRGSSAGSTVSERSKNIHSARLKASFNRVNEVSH
mmetsp:Transcript_27531/g.33422  ORF Transcript_27531/g.33422 Transcript_27531/m.33422 type:complete len:565 (-) Transcript_27531:299-1993(-)